MRSLSPQISYSDQKLLYLHENQNLTKQKNETREVLQVEGYLLLDLCKSKSVLLARTELLGSEMP